MAKELTDAAIEAGSQQALRAIEATRALYDILLALKRKDVPHNFNYTDQEKAELAALHRKRLLRRAAEEAAKAGITL